MPQVMAVICGRREAKCFSREHWTGGIALIWLRKSGRGAQRRTLIHRNFDLAVAGHPAWAAETPSRPVSAWPTNDQAAEGRMTVAQQAFLFTGELFVLSLVAIYAMWFVDRLRRNFLR
jgi:hypothetical protein